jgi:O-antigen ligase
MTDNRRVLTLNFIMFLVGAVIVGGYSVATGEYRLAESGRGRVASLAMNANSFAWIMLLATVGLAYLWMVPTRLSSLKYLILGLGMTSAGIAAILSGSRTQLIGIAFFYLCWMWFCYRRLLLRSPARALVVMAALAGMGFLFVTYLERSGTMERFTNLGQALQGRVTSGAAFTRIHLYREGWNIFLQHPFTGIGLGNFRWFSPSALSAHSEYMEILCNTGAPGFVLYFAVLLVLWRRTGKVLRYSQDESARRIASLTRALIATVMLTNLGQWNYYDKAYWIVFGSLIGYTNAVWYDLKTYMGAESGASDAGLAPASAWRPQRVSADNAMPNTDIGASK